MKRLTKSEFIKKARLIHGNYYSYDKTVYIKSISKVIITCPIHGDFSQRPNDHLSGRNGCPHCKFSKISALKRKDSSDLLKAFMTVHGTHYSYDEINYINNKTNVTISCPTHGAFSMSPSKHLSGNGCPSCGGSNGEQIVSQALRELGIKFVQQHIFKDLKGDINSLKFDFFLPDLNILIEYDGEHHFFHNKMFNYKRMEEQEAIDKFLKLKEYDAIKNSYAIRNKIYLLRIPYLFYTKNRVKQIILDFIQYSILNLPQFDENFSYVEMRAPIHPKFRE